MAINLRQKAGSELAFVTVSNGATSADVIIDAMDVPEGKYQLVLESFDT